jgi:integrase
MTEAITSDNFHLSRPIPATSQAVTAAVSNPLSFQGCTDAKVLEFVAAATSPNTRRAYQSDIEHFLATGGSIPATPAQVALYLVDNAAAFSMATLARRLAGIRAAHVEKGFPDPTKPELVRLTFRGIRRRFGRRQNRVAALSSDDLQVIVASLGQSAKDIRDAAILLIGFAGAFRRSELVSIDRNAVNIRDTGAGIVLQRSKTDQTGNGRTVFIPRVRGQLCPVTALERWLLVSEISVGPVFRPITRSGKVLPARISADAVACILKDRVQRVGRDPAHYSGHSLRAGFVTGAARIGVPQWRIRAQTGHLSDSVLERYIREAEASSMATVKMIAASLGQLPSSLHEI